MDSKEKSRLLGQLVVEWAQGNLPNQSLALPDYVQAIDSLQRATQNTERTAYIFNVLLQQAQFLGQSSEWLDHELHFEALAEALGDRMELALLELQQGVEPTNAMLDLYNQRLNRFRTPD